MNKGKLQKNIKKNKTKQISIVRNATGSKGSEFWEVQALQGEARYRTCVPADVSSGFYSISNVDDRESQIRAADFRQPLLLPYRWLKRPVLDTHGFPTLIPGHERETLEQTVIVHCDKWEARGRWRKTHGKRRTIWTCWSGNEETAYEDTTLQQMFLSLFWHRKQWVQRIADIQKLKHPHRFSNILKTMQHSQAV